MLRIGGLWGLLRTLLVIVWALILALVGGRFLALLLNANRDSEIVDRLLRHSDFWVKPFFGILGLENRAVETTGGVFEPASLIAFAVYLVAGMVLVRLLTPGPRRPFLRGRWARRLRV
jgi:hypothetical protein